MATIFYVVAGVWLLAAIGAGASIVSDIQLIVVAVCLVGAVDCFGFATLLRRKSDAK